MVKILKIELLNVLKGMFKWYSTRLIKHGYYFVIVGNKTIEKYVVNLYIIGLGGVIAGFCRVRTQTQRMWLK